MTTSLAVCAIFKNEKPYLQEWLEFHRMVGVEKFYLYNNISTDDFLEVLQPYIDNGLVDLVDWPYPSPCQLQAYTNCIEKLKGQKLWVAFIDLDEFLFAPCADKVTDILNQLPIACAVGVNWMCFGSGGLEKYDDRPLTERFHLRCNENNWENTHIKSIIRMDQNVRVGGDPHYFQVEKGTYNENGVAISGPWSPHTSRLLRINHYKTKSREEWIARIEKGKADNPGYQLNWKHFDCVNTFEVDDRTIQRFLPELKNKIQ